MKLIIHLRGAFSSSRKQNKYLLSHRVTKGMSQQRKEEARPKQERSDTSSLLGVKEMERWRALGFRRSEASRTTFSV